jgi:hypothetical protein
MTTVNIIHLTCVGQRARYTSQANRKIKQKTVTKVGFGAENELVELPIRLRRSENKRNPNYFYTEKRTVRPKAFTDTF